MRVLKDIRQPITIFNIPLLQFAIWFVIATIVTLITVAMRSFTMFFVGLGVVGGSFWFLSQMTKINLDFLTEFPKVIIMLWARKK